MLWTYNCNIHCKIKLCFIIAVIRGHLFWKWWGGIVGRHYFSSLVYVSCSSISRFFLYRSLLGHFFSQEYYSLFASECSAMQVHSTCDMSCFSASDGLFLFWGFWQFSLVRSDRLIKVRWCISMCCGWQVSGCRVGFGIWCWLGLYPWGSSRGRMGGSHVCPSWRGESFR